ncbi:cysteine hydrolase family protein [Acidisoma silvae]|nr:cysteine hydrolase [Acidisoma silvae]
MTPEGRMTELSTARPWLIIVDMQPAFGHPDSPWCTPGLDATADRIDLIRPLFGSRVVFTRFVPPVTQPGSWAPYYAKWPFALEERHDWLWALLPRWQERPSIASHQFSKWNTEMQNKLGPNPSVYICGVSTDCCVLGTALGAVDDGAHVRVITDACAAKNPEIQDRALGLLAARSPQLEFCTTSNLLVDGVI